MRGKICKTLASLAFISLIASIAIGAPLNNATSDYSAEDTSVESIVDDNWHLDLTLPFAFSVSIISPHDDQVFKQNEVIAFNCSVSGGTHPYSFKWISSIDGLIGDEKSLSKSLSVGEHVISLSVTGSSGQNDTAYVNISVIMETKEEEAKKEKIITATTIVVPDDYPTIQQAVDNATDGDTIFVRSGTYPENIRIDKDLTLEGEDRDTTIIDGGGSGDCVRVSSADVTISGFTIKNAGNYNYGVYAYSSNLNLNNATISNCGDDAIYFDGKSLTLRDSVLENCSGGLIYDYYATGNATIERNIIRNNTGSGLEIRLSSGKSAVINDNFINSTGTWSDGIYCDIWSNGEVTMENNTVKNSGDDGIYIGGVITPVLMNNTITNCGGHGVSLSISSTTKNLGKLRKNILTNNKYGFSITGTSIESYYQDIDTSNTINGKPMYYLVEEENKVFDGIPVGYLGLVSCKNIKAENLELTNNGQGILIVDTSNSKIYFNNCSNNGDGIKLSFSSDNTLTNNTASNNRYGIYLYSSSNNTITKNNAYPNHVRGIKIDASSSDNRVYMNNFNFNISPQIKFSPHVWVKYDHLEAIAHCGFFAGDSGIVTINVSKEYDHDLLDTATFYVSSGGYYDFEIFTCLYRDPINPRWTTLVVSSPSATSTLEIVFEGQAYGVCILPPLIPPPVPLEHFLNSTEEITYTYKGNNYTNYLGNYWSNYEEEYPNATEIDSTGIWDTPYYNIDLGKDNYPLVGPWENYFPEEIQPPIANFTYSPDNPIVNQLITFNASTSYDPDGTIVKYEWDFGDGNTTNTTDPITTNSYASADNYTVTLTVTDNDGETNTTTKLITVSEKLVFDTGSGTYPSIFGTHNGTITPNQTIIVSKLYTYPCAGTGGHTEYARIWNSSLDTNATWNGYVGDWHNISFNKSLILVKDEIYNYTIRTGSYPQIIHARSKPVTGGVINCIEFIDANGKNYDDWIPAIRLHYN